MKLTLKAAEELAESWIENYDAIDAGKLVSESPERAVEMLKKASRCIQLLQGHVTNFQFKLLVIRQELEEDL